MFITVRQYKPSGSAAAELVHEATVADDRRLFHICLRTDIRYRSVRAFRVVMFIRSMHASECANATDQSLSTQVTTQISSADGPHARSVNSADCNSGRRNYRPTKQNKSSQYGIMTTAGRLCDIFSSLQSISQSNNARSVGRRCTTRPGALTVVSYKHDQKVHSWVVFWMYSYQ